MSLVALMGVLLAVVSVFTLQQLRNQNDIYRRLVMGQVSAALHMQEAIGERFNWNRLLNGVVAQSAINDLPGMQSYIGDLAKSEANLKQHYQEIVADLPQLKAEVEGIEGQFGGIARIADREVSKAVAGDAAGAWKVYVEEVRPPLAGPFTSGMQQLGQTVFQAVADATVAANQAYEAAVIKTLLLAGIGLVMVSVFAYILARTTITRPLKETEAMLGELAGKLATDKVTLGGETHRVAADEIGRCRAAAVTATSALDTLLSEMREVIVATQAGDLTARTDTARHGGEYATLLRGGFNELVETLSAPTQEASAVIQRLAGGDLKGRMNGSYEGDLRAFKMNMNRSLDALSELLGELGRTFLLLEAGDLRGVLAGAYPGDFAQLQSNVNRSIAHLRETLLAFATDADHVSSSAVQTSAAAQQVARTSATQLITLTQIAKAIEAVSSSMTQVAGNAEASNTLTRDAVELVGVGSERLSHLIAAVQRIAEGQNRVGRITETITRIADKTHVLAINAGLEAARAGEHGIGFGFVAQQIGKLAEDAAIAARDIAAIITTAVEDIGRSTQDADAASTAIGEVVRATREAGTNVAAITEAIAAQSKAIVSLSERIEDLQAGGQETAAAAEEISVTMENLVRMATANLAMVGKLKLGEQKFPVGVVTKAAE